MIVIEPSVDITENVNDEDKLDSTSRNEDHIDDWWYWNEVKYVNKFKQENCQATIETNETSEIK